MNGIESLMQEYGLF